MHAGCGQSMADMEEKYRRLEEGHAGCAAQIQRLCTMHTFCYQEHRQFQDLQQERAHANFMIDECKERLSRMIADIGVVVLPHHGDGVVINSVEEGSTAAAAGLRPDDAILRVNTKNIDTTADFVDYLSSLTPGDNCVFVVHRGEQERLLMVKVGTKGLPFAQAEATRRIASWNYEDFKKLQTGVSKMFEYHRDQLENLKKKEGKKQESND